MSANNMVAILIMQNFQTHQQDCLLILSQQVCFSLAFFTTSMLSTKSLAATAFTLSM